MKDFETVYKRQNTLSFKWDSLKQVFNRDDILPMWVADMDFKAPEEVNQAIIERAKHGIYGYTVIDDDVREAVCKWLKRRHQWSIQKEWLSFSSGVIPALQIAIQALTERNDRILIQTPVYSPFYDVIKNQEREIVKNPLSYKNGRYEISFEHFEQQLQKGVKAFILCSPHNPVGRVWTKEELETIVELCHRYNVLILSDEIHCDLIYPNFKHIPIASLSEEAAQITITFMAPSKTFNLAGLQAAYTITSNKKLHRQILRQMAKQSMTFLNTMGITALEAAYTYGEKWLEQLLEVLTSHKDYVKSMFAKHIPEIKVVSPQGTYLLWLDCSGLNMTHQELRKFMIEEAKIGLNDGLSYGEDGAQFMRMNIACPKSTLEEGANRIIQAVHRLKQ